MKFAHLGDCHLGAWAYPELKALNFQSFQFAVEKCIKEKVDFILIAGDLFDSAYPPIDTLKDTFRMFRCLKEAGIPVFIIAGSHDYSLSGKTFLDVLEKAGFCTNVSVFEEKDGFIMLQPTIYKNVAIYGYPGKKSGIEVDEIVKLKIQDSPGFFKILMLHTAIRDAVGSLPIKAVSHETLPKVDYVALAHLHISYCRENRVYSGPIFPNNLAELEELKHGFFYIVNDFKIKKEEINLKDVLPFSIQINDSFSANEKIIDSFSGIDVKDKIIILRLSGILEKGKISDINFSKVEEYLKKKEAFLFLKSTSKLYAHEDEIKMDMADSFNLENEIIKNFEEKNPSKFNSFIPLLIKTLQMEKHDEEKSAVFEERLISETKKILKI